MNPLTEVVVLKILEFEIRAVTMALEYFHAALLTEQNLLYAKKM
jgi:hypothetical protein